MENKDYDDDDDDEFHEMASVASQLIEEVTAHAQRDSLEDA